MNNVESHLWKLLRRKQLGERFWRQCPIGRYISICLFAQKMGCRSNSGQHAELAQDRIRDACLVRLGYGVLRFWNNDVLENSAGIYGMIQIALLDSPHPDLPPHAGEREEQVEHRLQPPHASDRKEKP